jgi:hypothetical protein
VADAPDIAPKRLLRVIFIDFIVVFLPGRRDAPVPIVVRTGLPGKPDETFISA